MHPTIYAQRNAIAEAKLQDQSSRIAAMHSAEDALERYRATVTAITSYPSDVQALLEKEARVLLNDAILSDTTTVTPGGEVVSEEESVEGLNDLEGIGPETVQRLNEAGFHTKDDVRAASNAELNKIEGVGPTTVKRLRDATEEK